MTQHEHPVRQATASDAAVVAELLDAFNREFDTPTPGTEKLTARLRHLLAGDGLVALLTGEPANGVAILSFRPSVWYEGPAALLDYCDSRLHALGLSERGAFVTEWRDGCRERSSGEPNRGPEMH